MARRRLVGVEPVERVAEHADLACHRHRRLDIGAEAVGQVDLGVHDLLEPGRLQDRSRALGVGEAERPGRIGRRVRQRATRAPGRRSDDRIQSFRANVCHTIATNRPPGSNARARGS